jgi:hypothetical protein
MHGVVFHDFDGTVRQSSPQHAISPGRHAHLFFAVDSFALLIEDRAVKAVRWHERNSVLFEAVENFTTMFP